jgi:predicted Mrr-cat superfamily restriction endonuclease
MEGLDTEDRDYYMVRAKDQTPEEFEFFFEEQVVAIGWSKVDVRDLNTKEEVDEAMSEHYAFWRDASPRVQGRRENEILRFNNIESRDRVVVPYHSSVALATATDDHHYEPGDSLDFSNRIRVNYLRQDGEVVAVPRNELSEGLARRLRVRGMTINDLNEFDEEIERLYQSGGVGWQAHLEAEEENRRDEFRSKLLENIRSGNTNLEAGGLGLEHLVAELLGCEGYESERLSKKEFDERADADVSAVRSDRFGEQKLLVQVKHHQGGSGTHGIEQLIAIPKQAPEEYEDHKLVFVTTGSVDEAIRNRASNHDIDVLEGHDFADWLLDHVNEMDPEMRRRLGISELPQLTLR